MRKSLEFLVHKNLIMHFKQEYNCTILDNKNEKDNIKILKKTEVLNTYFNKVYVIRFHNLFF